MNSVPCPGCGLPRQAEHVGVVPCPVCEYGARDPTPDVVAPAPPRLDPTRELATAPRKPMSVTPVAFAAGVVVGVLAVLGWQAYSTARESVTTNTLTATTEERKAEPVPPVPPKPREVAPPPRIFVAVAPPPHLPFRPPPARVTQVDHPNAEYPPLVPPGATVTLKGRAKRLKVPALEGGAVLDASELEVEDVIVVGKIDGGSRLRVAAHKRVTFQAKIDGRSTVEVIAPTATVMFLDVKGRDVTGIAGGSVVRVTAHVTSFLGHIRGADTVVTVTVARGGSVGFVEIDGPARFEYRKAAPADPDPVLSRGKVGAAATVARVE